VNDHSFEKEFERPIEQNQDSFRATSIPRSIEVFDREKEGINGL
jgi:type I restriction-modification system DNA methylase subunit